MGWIITATTCPLLYFLSFLSQYLLQVNGCQLFILHYTDEKSLTNSTSEELTPYHS